MNQLFDTRKFRPGQEFELSHGIHVRTVDGYKGDGDIRWELLVPSGWQPIPMSLVFLLTDGFYQNEELLYPVNEGKRGGSAFIQALRRSADIGWEPVTEQLCCEKRRKNGRK